jgi:general secretion pathway protein K
LSHGCNAFRCDDIKLIHNNQKGAALLAVLVVAVIMVVLMGVASTMLESRLFLAQDAKQQFTDQVKVYTKQNELVYLLATQRVTAAGVSKGRNIEGFLKDNEDNWLLPIIGDEIRADGYLNKEISGLMYSIQNEDGLIPLNSAGQYWLIAWLKAKRVNSRVRAQYADGLADYADADNLRRPAGAEQLDYDKNITSENQITLQPANYLLQSCNEIWGIAGWHTLLTKFPLFAQYCSLRRGTSINMNAIPISLWQSLWPSSAVKVAKLRDSNNWFLTYSSILDIEPSVLNLTDDYYTYLGGQTFRIKLQLNNVMTTLSLERGLGRVVPYTIRQ